MTKKLKRIIIFMIILLIICITLLLFFSFTSKSVASKKLNKVNDALIKDQNIVEFELPDNIGELIAYYEGNIENRTIYKNLYYFANELVPKYYSKLKNYSDEDINNYFDKNKEVIYIELGMDSQEKFYSFANYIKKLNGTELLFSNFSILKTSVRSQGRQD